ncbi:helix-turn-helix domain-containing protein [Glutamicibacter sp.]|uniref:helix-turn-helix domain-containing protein n=1 Tax=Glutamicibacter sp. TaxID=1931995 RepID=UPI002FDF3951
MRECATFLCNLTWVNAHNRTFPHFIALTPNSFPHNLAYMNAKRCGRPSKPRTVDNDSERIGLTLRTIRQMAGVTGQDMAKAMDVGGSTYDGYEAGSRRMTYEQVQEAASYLTFHLRMVQNSRILIQPESIAIDGDPGLRAGRLRAVAA